MGNQNSSYTTIVYYGDIGPLMQIEVETAKRIAKGDEAYVQSFLRDRTRMSWDDRRVYMHRLNPGWFISLGDLINIIEEYNRSGGNIIEAENKAHERACVLQDRVHFTMGVSELAIKAVLLVAGVVVLDKVL